MADNSEGYNIHTDYKHVEFEFGGVHLLWNCCAIVKKILELEAKVRELEHKVEQMTSVTI